MPLFKEHGDQSEKLYGVRGDDLHEWIDAPVVIDGPKHRSFRHSANCVILHMFNKYGEKLARNILLDHLVLNKIEDEGASEYAEAMKEKVRDDLNTRDLKPRRR